jgi:prepilin-type N-terminal cleavage/methylation domain-containing protein
MKRPRPGYTLVEVVVTMTIASAVLVTATVWLVFLIRGERAGREHLLLATSRHRLAEQFRRDIHAAVDVASDDSAKAAQDRLVRLLLPDERMVDYELLDRRIIRSEQRQDQLKRRETWRIPAHASARVEQPEDDQLMFLIVDRATGQAAEDPPPWLHVAARLASDHRFSRKGSTEENR